MISGRLPGPRMSCFCLRHSTEKDFAMTLALTAELRTEISNTRQCERDAKIYQRLSALLWLNGGMTQDQVADHLGVTSRQVRKWVRLFREQGLEALCTLNYLGGQ